MHDTPLRVMHGNGLHVMYDTGLRVSDNTGLRAIILHCTGRVLNVCQTTRQRVWNGIREQQHTRYASNETK